MLLFWREELRNICRTLALFFCSIYWLTRYIIHVKPNNWTHSTFTGTNHKSPVFGWWNLLNSDSLFQEIPSALACFEDLGHFGVPQKLEPQHFVYHQFPPMGYSTFWDRLAMVNDHGSEWSNEWGSWLDWLLYPIFSPWWMVESPLCCLYIPTAPPFLLGGSSQLEIGFFTTSTYFFLRLSPI